MTTYRIDPFMEMVARSGLQPLTFAHRGALADVAAEVLRIRALEQEKESPGNFVLFLGRAVKGPCRDRAASFRLNPCLAGVLSPWRLAPLKIPGRLGHTLEALDRSERSFLGRFRTPVSAADLSREELARAHHYSEQLFLLRYRDR